MPYAKIVDEVLSKELSLLESGVNELLKCSFIQGSNYMYVYMCSTSGAIQITTVLGLQEARHSPVNLAWHFHLVLWKSCCCDRFLC